MKHTAPRYGMIFPDYGSQYVGMAKELYDNERLIQEYFEEAGNCLNLNFVKLCFASSDVELSSVTNAYPALFLIEAATAALAYERGIQPNIVASIDIIGWYASLHAARSITLPDGLYVLHKIALLYDLLLDKDGYSGLKIKKITATNLAQLCKKISTDDAHVVITRTISDQESTVAGHSAAVDALRKLLRDEYDGTVEVENLDLHSGFYASLEHDLQVQMNQYLEKIDFKDPQIPVVDPRNGELLITAEDLKKAAREIFFSRLEIPLVAAQLISWERTVITAPALKFQSKLQELLSERSFLTIDTSKELSDVIALFVPPLHTENVSVSSEE